ncbi:MAG: choice-of-anchor Q domain-containing protein [Limisphaerales bacterium]
MVQVIGCLFTNNGAEGEDGGQNPGEGGAIFNAGILLVTNCSFLTNWAQGGAGYLDRSVPGGVMRSGGSGYGGTIYNANYAVIVNCLFNANSTIGGWPGSYGGCSGPGIPWFSGPGGPGANANGGAIYNSSALVIIDSVLASNNCTASPGGEGCEDGAGGPGGDARGAGLLSVSGSVSLLGTTFSSNLALGGDGAVGTSVFGVSVADYTAGNGGAGGQAAGGGASLDGGTLNIVNCTFVSNTILAGIGNNGAPGDPADDVTGGNGGNGGNAKGGAICVSNASAYVTNATFVGNVSTAGGGGQAGGGGTGETGLPGSPDVVEGNTIAVGPGLLTLLNSILSCAPGQTNAFGPIVDAGFNLNSDATGFLTNATSFNSVVDPGLGTLGNYGGPTPTIPLLPGSIAIDHADPASFPPTDQRGYPRPFGSAPDIGAFEYWSVTPNSLGASIVSNGMFDLVFWGANGQTFTTLATSNLIDWLAISTNTIAVSNQFEMFLPMNDGWTFYQTLSR